MKKINFILALVVCFGLVQACKNKKDSTTQADSINAVKDTSKTLTGDTSKAVTPPIEVSKEDAQFAVDAANGGMAEVELGTLAEQKGSDPKVKDFGKMMVVDHSKVNDELKALANKLKITLPATVGKDEQKTKDDLSQRSGKDFDKAYVKTMVDDHKKDIKLFEDAAKNAKDADLKAFAQKNLPTLKLHLDTIQKIDSSIK